MEDYTFEIITHFTGVCKCCMQEGTFKSLWKERLSDIDGEKEIYGVMLIECFGLPWLPPDSDDIEEQICDECIWMLRMAYNFRKQILTTQENLQEQFKNACDEKEEKDDAKYYIDHDYEDVAYLEEVEVSEVGTEVIVLDSSEPSTNKEDSKPCSSEPYIKKEDPIPHGTEPSINRVESIPCGTEPSIKREDSIPRDSASSPEREDFKIPELTKKGKARVYNKYKGDVMKRCLAEVKSGELTTTAASKKYNVPRKYITNQLRISHLDEKRRMSAPVKEPSDPQRHRFEVFRQELVEFLHYTNALPFRTKMVHTFCLYCQRRNTGAKDQFFEDYEELKTHVRTAHANDRVSKITQVVSDRYKNETVKVDIENLHCTECNVPLWEWDDVFVHMKKVHNLDLDEARKRLVPFVLKPTMKCVFCDETYQNFHHLDTHMNCHYDNYICAECGATFVSHARICKHIEAHGDFGKHPCEHCGKIFTRDLYRKKHVRNVHKRQLKVKCFYCDVRMFGELKRHQHIVEHHKDKVKTITCEHCGKTYTYRPNYMRHMGRMHREFTKLPPKPNKVRNIHLCTICNREYWRLSYLKQHIAREHADEGIGILQVMDQSGS